MHMYSTMLCFCCDLQLNNFIILIHFHLHMIMQTALKIQVLGRHEKNRYNISYVYRYINQWKDTA